MDSNQAAVVLVTGGARRLGAEIVRQMHAAGARVVVHFRSSGDEAAQLAATLNALRPGSVSIVQADLLSSNAGERLVAAAVAAYGRLDALVNNASSFFPTPLGTIDEAAWSDLVGSNLKAPLFITQAAAPISSSAGVAWSISWTFMPSDPSAVTRSIVRQRRDLPG